MLNIEYLDRNIRNGHSEHG